MVFAFLPTTVMLICSFLAMGVSVFLISTRDAFYADIGAGVMFMAAFGTLLTVKSSHKLYISSMGVLHEDFDKWYRKQQKIAAKSLAAKKLFVLSNIINGALAYEKLDEASESIERFGRHISKKGHPYYNYIYLDKLLSLMEKKHDLSDSKELLSQMYEMLNSKYFPDGNIKTSFISHFEHTRMAVEFYKRTPEMLRTTDRHIAEQFNVASKLYLSVIVKSSPQVSYPLLTCYYDIGLSYAVMGNTENASQYFEYISSSKRNYPLVSRVRTYLSTGDIFILMQTMP